MKKHLFSLLLIMILTSCGTSQILKDDISNLKSKMYHLESQNKELTEKLDNLTQRVTIQERNLKTVTQELDGVKSELKKRIEIPVITSIQTSTSSTKSTSTKSATSAKSNSSTVSKSTSTYSGRCQATTKKGTQCKRMAQDGRKYCWQH